MASTSQHSAENWAFETGPPSSPYPWVPLSATGIKVPRGVSLSSIRYEPGAEQRTHDHLTDAKHFFVHLGVKTTFWSLVIAGKARSKVLATVLLPCPRSYSLMPELAVVIAMERIEVVTDHDPFGDGGPHLLALLIRGSEVDARRRPERSSTHREQRKNC